MYKVRVLVTSSHEFVVMDVSGATAVDQNGGFRTIAILTQEQAHAIGQALLEGLSILVEDKEESHGNPN